MRQVVNFDIDKAGTTKYLCLANVRKGYGIGAKYPDATTAWNNTQQHRDRSFPAGCSVPVFYSWVGTVSGERKNWGHIAVRLPDGRVWTDGKYYANVDERSARYLSGSSYLGWGESVNGVRVVENVIIPSNKGDDMIKPGDEDILRIIGSEVKGWDFNSTHNGSLDAREMAAWKGRDFRQLIREGWAEGAWYRNLKAKQAGLQSQVDKLTSELSTRPTKAQLDEVVAKLQRESEKVAKAELEREKAIKMAEEQSAKYLEELNKKSEDTKLLDSIKDIISKLVARFK